MFYSFIACLGGTEHTLLDLDCILYRKPIKAFLIVPIFKLLSTTCLDFERGREILNTTFSTGVWRELRDNSATQWCNGSIAENRLLAPEGK